MADSGEMNFGYANRRVSSIDEGNIYRGKQIQETVNKIILKIFMNSLLNFLQVQKLIKFLEEYKHFLMMYVQINWI